MPRVAHGRAGCTETCANIDFAEAGTLDAKVNGKVAHPAGEQHQDCQPGPRTEEGGICKLVNGIRIRVYCVKGFEQGTHIRIHG